MSKDCFKLYQNRNYEFTRFYETGAKILKYNYNEFQQETVYNQYYVSLRYVVITFLHHYHLESKYSYYGVPVDSILCCTPK